MSEKLNKKGTLERFIPILMILAVALAFVVGILWQKVRNLESGEGVGNGIEQPADFPDQLPPEGKLSEEQAANIPEITEKDYIRGSKDAKVFLIEYSDFECPYCKDFHETAQQIVDEYAGQVGWVYRHFPLDVRHAKARPEAIAAECAAELGGNEGFWAFIDKIYEITPSNDGLDLDILPDLAVQVGLNSEEFEACLEDNRYADKVESDYQGGAAAGVTGTPGNFIINDKGEAWLIPGAVPFETLKETIDEALQS